MKGGGLFPRMYYPSSSSVGRVFKALSLFVVPYISRPKQAWNAQSGLPKLGLIAVVELL